jgi:anti-anti-sigma regulatory factor
MQTATRTILHAGTHLDAVQALRLRFEADVAWAADESVIVDVRSVEHMDMAGLSALAWFLIECRRRNEGAYLLGPLPPVVSGFLEMHAFDRFFQVRLAP